MKTQRLKLKLNLKQHLLCSLLVVAMIVCGVGSAVGQTLTAGKPYALYSSNKGTNLYYDPESSSENTINNWSDKCILTFASSTSNNGYYSIKNKNGYYASASSSSNWETYRTQTYTANTCDWKFSSNGSNYRLTSRRNTNRYLGVDKTNAGSALYYDKNANNSISWTINAVYSIVISGNPSSATATIGGKSYSNGDYYLTTSQTVSPSLVTPTSISGYDTTVEVNDNSGIITIKYKRITTLTFDNVAPTISSDGWNIILPSVTLKAGDTEITGQTITYSATGCSCNNGYVNNIANSGATITATFAGNDTYAGSSATYTITTTEHQAQSGTVVSVADVAITPSSATLDLEGSQKYSVPASTTGVTRTCEQYSEYACPVGKVYKYSSLNWQYTSTPPTMTENTNATVNFSSIEWKFEEGATNYFSASANYSTSTTEQTLTRNTTKRDTDKDYTITATVYYGSIKKELTAKVTIPLTEVNLTSINVDPNSYTLAIGETANIEYTYDYERGAKPYVDISYTGYDSRIISVDADGKITAKAAGTTTVTIQSKKKDGSNGVSATVNVTVNVPSETAGYVITYQNAHFLGGTSTTDITTFNPSTCLWKGNSGSTWQNSSNYYLRYNSGLELNATQSTNFSITNNTKLYCSITSGNWWNETTNNYYVRWSGTAWQASTTDTQNQVVYPVTKYSYPAVPTDPEFSGADTFSSLETKKYTISKDAECIPAYFDYVFYNNNHHYCLTESSNATPTTPGKEAITYSWSVSDTSGKVTVDNNGNVTYNDYFEDADGVDVTLTLTATSASGVEMTASKVIHFESPKTNPTSISAEDVTVNVGKTATIPVTLQPNPCYKKLECTSSDTSIATVDNKGVVTGVKAGTATITIQALLIDGSKPANLVTTATVTVKNKVATPEISFEPNGLTATATIECETTGVEIRYTTDGNDPTETSTLYTTPFSVNNLATVKAIAIKTGADASYWIDSDIATATYSAQKVPTPEIKIRGNEVTFDCDEPGVTYRYTTDGSTPTATSGTVWNGNTITNISVGATIKVIATKTGFAPSDVAEATMRKANVVYLCLAGAQGNGSGSSAANAVGTWANAFAKLGYGPNAKYLRQQWAAHGLTDLSNHSAFNGLTDADFTSTVDNNIIYLVGDVTEAQFTQLMGRTKSDPTSESNLMNQTNSSIIGSGFFKPVTISGKYANSSSNTEKYAQISINAGTKYTLNEDMRFEYVEFHGNNGTNSTDFMLAYYDLEMGEGIIMTNFLSTKDFSTYHHGYAQGVTNAAHILFYGGLTCDKRFGTDPNGALNFDYYLPHPDGYKITIRSGYFSTISPGGTQWNNTTSLNGTMGSPNTPVKCTITVDIDRAWNTAHQSGVLAKQSTNGYPDCDVAVVIAGTHEGTMYGDVDINIKSGRIDRVVNGTFGANNFVTNHPADSYFGRANILIDPREPSSAETSYVADKNAMVVIRELYGGGLGRFKSDSSKDNQSSTYFYGKSSVVINGGTFSSALYASGAGGVNGVGDDNHYTPDTKLPYWNGNNIAYGTYAQFKTGRATKPFVVKCRNADGTTEDVDLYNTSAKIEIHGGVFGTPTAPASIYGGGYGFVDSELIDYTTCKPNTRAGAIFASAGQQASSVTIDGDAIIYGNVYGAGRGDDKYYNAGISYNSDKYTQLGQVYGNVELTIGGKAKIYGNLFGAGQGIANAALKDMAHLYGDVTLTVGENALITGDIYGGGANGSTNGDINIAIKDAMVAGSSETTGNVYGGANAADVNGDVEVNANGGTVNNIFGGNNVSGSISGNIVVNVEKNSSSSLAIGNVYGAGNQAAYSPATVGAYPEVNIKAGTVSGNVYGGGLGATADVTSNPKVTLTGGTATNVFGGGSLADTNGNTTIYVNGGSVAEAVYGGGALADTKDTHVYLYGGTVKDVYGGGLGSSTVAAKVANATVTVGKTDSSVASTITGSVFGCNNLNGTPTGNATVNVYKTTPQDGKDYHVYAVYGGGNKAAYDPEPAKGTSSTMTTKVEVFNCDNSIQYVYGGGNAASTPATHVVIHGGDFDWVFGGGNGKTEEGQPTNPGANVGYYTDTDINDVKSHGTAYGTGVAKTEIYDGVINHLFGGSNTRGNIRESAISRLEHENEDCNFSIGEVYSAGNEAYMDGAATMNLGCIPGLGVLYGGARRADINNDINMTITSGTYGQIFGGNNESGSINGSITVNIEETGCKPIVIGEVYGCGNDAAYTTPEGKADPVVNAISFTKIGTIYGGGFGEGATVTGSPTVNLNVVKGKYAEKIGNKIGTVGTVFGGGNAAAVVGGTNVNIGTEAGKSADIQAIDVTIPTAITGTGDQTYHGTGNVFGGGNNAEVSGKTNVVVGTNK